MKPIPLHSDENDPQFDAALFQLVAERVGLAVVIYEVADDLVYLSEQWAQWTQGVAAPSYLSLLEFRALLHDDDLPALEAALQRAQRPDGGVGHAELRVRSKQKGWRWINAEGRLVERDDAGAPLRYFLTLTDISQQKAEGYRLHPDQDHFQAAYENSPMGILLGMPDGQILSANPAVCALSGYGEDELRILGRDRLFDTDDVRLAELLKRRRYAGRSQGVVALRRRDGQQIDVTISSVLFTDSHGVRKNVLSLSALGRDKMSARVLARLKRMYDARRQCSRIIINSKNAQSMLAEVCRIAVEQGKLSLAWVAMVDPKTLEVVPAACHGPASTYLDGAYFSADARVEEGQGPIGVSLRTARPYVSNDFMHEPTLQPWHGLAAQHQFGSVAVLPMQRHETLAGAFVLYATQKDFFSTQVLQLLLEMTEQISFALDNFQREAAFRESELRFRTLWDATMDAVLVLDASANIHYANPAVSQLYGYRVDELVGRSFSMLCPAEDMPAHVQQIQRYLDTPAHSRHWQTTSGSGLRKDGRHFPTEISIGDAEIDGIRQFYFCVRDITDRMRTAQLLNRQNSLLRMIAGGSVLPVTLAALASFVEDEIAQRRCVLLVCASDGAEFKQAVGASSSSSSGLAERLLFALGGPAQSLGAAIRSGIAVKPGDVEHQYWIKDLDKSICETRLQVCSLQPVMGRNASVLGAIVLLRTSTDATVTVDDSESESQTVLLQMAADLCGLAIENQNAQERIAYLANHDELTGLLNRTALAQALQHALARAGRDKRQIGLLCIEMGDLRQIIKQHGHNAGDDVLRETGHRLQTALRDVDVAAYAGAEQFIIMLEQCSDREALELVANKLIGRIGEPLRVGSAEYAVSASIGICICPDDGVDLMALLRQSGLALGRAKKQGRNHYSF